MYITLYIILKTVLPLLLPVNLNIFVLDSCVSLLFFPFYVIYCVTHIIGPNVGSTDNKAAEGICSSQAGNKTACQLVANMCTLVLFRDDYAGSPCKVFQDSKHIPTSDSSSLPWLYYGEGDAQTVLSRKKITAKYSMDPSNKVRNLCNAAGTIFRDVTL